MTKEMICIVCPMGCHLNVSGDAPNNLTVKGNACKRGEVYGIEEVVSPKRTIPTTVVVKGGTHARLPVKTSQPIPKSLIFDVMALINQQSVDAPVKNGDVIISNILETGADIVATRSMACKREIYD